MATAPKILAQSLPANTNLTDIYTVPALKSAVISNIFVCNVTGTDRTFRISVAIAGAADNNKQYLYYDEAAELNSTFEVGTLQLSAGDIVRVKSSLANALAFTITGIETT